MQLLGVYGIYIIRPLLCEYLLDKKKESSLTKYEINLFRNSAYCMVGFAKICSLTDKNKQTNKSISFHFMIGRKTTFTCHSGPCHFMIGKKIKNTSVVGDIVKQVFKYTGIPIKAK